jgi:hypothetical protein
MEKSRLVSFELELRQFFWMNRETMRNLRIQNLSGEISNEMDR